MIGRLEHPDHVCDALYQLPVSCVDIKSKLSNERIRGGKLSERVGRNGKLAEAEDADTKLGNGENTACKLPDGNDSFCNHRHSIRAVLKRNMDEW